MFEVLFKLKDFFKENWKRYTVAVFLLVVVDVIDVLPPQLIGVAVDLIHQGKVTPPVLWQLVLGLIGLALASYVISYFWVHLLFGGSFLLEKKLRSRLMEQFLRLTPSFYQRSRTGDLMARATNDLKAIATTAGFGILTLADSIFFMAAILVMMILFVHWKLTLASFLPLPLMAVLIQIYGKYIHTRFMEAQDSFGKMNDQVLETITGIRVIRAYVQEKASEARFQEITEEVYQKNREVARIDALFEPTIKILVGISYLIGLGYGAYLVAQQEMTLGSLVSFNIYLGMAIWPMLAIGEFINVMQRGNASLDRVMETLREEPDVKDPPSPQLITTPEVLRFRHVTFRYPTANVPSLVDVSFTLRRGETLGVVGKTGSGKTTLFRQFLREFPLGEGEVSINGIPLQEIPVGEIRKWIGYVPQDQFLFSGTVEENISFGVGEVYWEMMEHVLKVSALSEDMKRLPQGLKTVVGEKGVSLSGGQKQRIAIARALVLNPEILILDDALSAVDARTEAEILSHLRSERRGKTTLIASHRLSAVEHADWILVLDEGKVVEEGRHHDLLKWSGWYKEQYDRQKLEETFEEREEQGCVQGDDYSDMPSN
ncbi:ABC transporter (ATP-binding protein) involved in the signalling pathway that activates KinA during sporulation initiation [[Clostridium] ultunense Esp]|uniref:ABC transporter ATP-binding protein n=1 Tax=Thermicanus aegyptius TaxID=94009 RepID=UPI0002B70361|nr:ABC transporter transmembrane domain-containing protein [Thermicanus aegyptius]CCQ96125.1 ABC transporter (ATP-binding protein) involved in the signalling pathway that activates KinA during sporulation initiation [[Clostridium] ultunense Esp]